MSYLKKDILLIFAVVICTVVISITIGAFMDYSLFEKNSILIQNYQKINQIVKSFSDSKTAFNLYNRSHILQYLDEYKRSSKTIDDLFAELAPDLNKDWDCRLYFRIVTQMLEYRNECVEKFISFKPIIGSHMEDREYLQILNDSIETNINMLSSHYIDYINQENLESMQGHEKYRKIINAFILLIVGTLSILSYRIIKKVIKTISRINFVARELTANNFDVEDIQLTRYHEMNVFIDTINKMKHAINNLIQEINQYAKQAIKAEQQRRLLVEAKMKGLQMQINPHFLFNTLSLVVRSIQRGEKENSILLIKSTSDILRSSMDVKSSLIPLDKEIELLKSYINIQQLHLKNRVSFILDIRKTYSDDVLHVPPLIIQPIVENCVFHGLKDVTEGGLIIISITEYCGFVEVIVTDNGVGMKQETIDEIFYEKDRQSIGLYNVLERLKLYYKEDDVLNIESEINKGTKVTMKLYKNGGGKNV